MTAKFSISSFIFLFFLFCTVNVNAQSNTIQEKKIEKLNEKHKENCDKKGTIPGYRVQIHFGSDREKAKDEKAKFLKLYSEVPAYENYQQPNFKIRVGDFRTRLEAQKFLKDIKNDFSSSFVVTDEINYPKLY